MALRMRPILTQRFRLARLFFAPFSTVDSATEITHTGQKFAPDDYSVARFSLSEKLVNRQFAEKLIAEVPPIPCTEHIVSCDGGGGALGHPKVYINLDQPGSHTCGYCGLRYYLKGHEPH
ncbi:putative NADH dehydrogenase [ubiquinone] iron-sulfur protein 6, mitochondrial [Clonorchis sinensis]|uniref:NADH dehydrogenase [ubiquinone] iron-sulfur protein 6, mitochondrial n=1 Tax=Clonorchis sinensis TaxID=79923 RepID=A0A8T1MW07_CLOSI|nr:putative NADH dehydrogenase [ubiquinone] iron-sulfur protein 6, mitochondrial [Clonorchis sinensis]